MNTGNSAIGSQNINRYKPTLTETLRALTDSYNTITQPRPGQQAVQSYDAQGVLKALNAVAERIALAASSGALDSTDDIPF